MLIFNQAIKRIISDKVKMIMMLLMPIIFIVTFAVQDQNKVTVGIVNEDKSELSQKLIDQIASMSKVDIVYLDNNSMITNMIKGKADYSIVIDQGFEENIISGNKVELKEYYNQDKEKIYYVKLLVQTYIQDMQNLSSNSNNQKEEFVKALAIYESNGLQVDNHNEENDNIAQSRSAMGFLVQFMLYMSVMTAVLIVEDKASGIFFRIFSSPIELRRYILEYMLAFLVIGVTQEVIILTLIKVLFGMTLGKAPILLYILFAVFSMVCVSLGILLVLLLKKTIHAYIAIILLTTPMVMLGGCYWPINIMPDAMQKAALFIPTTWVMKEVDALLMGSVDMERFGKSILVLFVFAVILLGIGMTRKVDIGKQ